MIKYVPTNSSVVLEEIPRKVSLAVEISNCKGNCDGCHSPYLREDVGLELTEGVIDKLLDDNFGVDCFLFLGEGRDPQALLRLARYVKARHHIDVALYSGRQEVDGEFFQVFDYVKVGPYIPELGPLNSSATNQRLYRVTHEGDNTVKEDITSYFWGEKNTGR